MQRPCQKVIGLDRGAMIAGYGHWGSVFCPRKGGSPLLPNFPRPPLFPHCDVAYKAGRDPMQRPVVSGGNQRQTLIAAVRNSFWKKAQTFLHLSQSLMVFKNRLIPTGNPNDINLEAARTVHAKTSQSKPAQCCHSGYKR